MYSDGVIKQYGAEKQKHMPITKSNKNNCPKNAFFHAIHISTDGRYNLLCTYSGAVCCPCIV